ncbi:hypothetical protein ERJ75_000791700 [Trypanosoma vivax]|nr:hypothetical protein ERJ75_000791700 [Trypanosoma vivax]
MNKATPGSRDLPKGHQGEARSTRGPGKNQRGRDRGGGGAARQRLGRRENGVWRTWSRKRSGGGGEDTWRQRQNGATPKSSEKNKGEDRHKAQRSGRPFPRREVERLARVECEARQRGVGRGRTQETDEEHSREEDGLTGHRDMGGRTLH